MSQQHRRPIHAYCTPDAYIGWSTFAVRHRVTVSSLVEALGHKLGANPDANSIDLHEAIEHAATVSQARLGRGARSDV